MDQIQVGSLDIAFEELRESERPSTTLTLGLAGTRLGRIGSKEGGGWTALTIAAASDERRARLSVRAPVRAAWRKEDLAWLSSR
jgi:hypothetical protein